MTATLGADTTLEGLEGLPGVLPEEPLGPGGMSVGLTDPEHLLAAICALKDDRGFGHLELLTAVDGHEGVEGLDMVYGFTRRADNTTVMLRVPIPDSALHVPSLSGIWPGAAPLEREVYDLFGVVFDGHPNLTRIVLRDDFVGHPLRKSFPMLEDGVAPEAVAAAATRHGDAAHGPGDAQAAGDAHFESPFAAAAIPGDPVLHSQRVILNMGPQHPSTHGVLHVWLTLEGENVVAAEPTHGYLHRCIEKLCETVPYRSCTPLLDRCDYVSGYNTELAHVLAVEELAGIESTPKADYLRVLFCELVRITSHHTWFTAAGFDTGALTPFFPAFVDREKILDFFETVSGARMMFNYFRPGGVRADMQPEAAKYIREFLKDFDRSVDEYETLLTGNEIFRFRTRGIGFLPMEAIEQYGITGPMARASGWDYDLRRDRPYAAYDRIPVNVQLGTAGDTFDRYAVRVAEMRESARIALEALEGMPEGPYIAEGVPRVLKPPAGAAYRSVESPRGELGIFLVSDGTANPWRLKVRSGAFSNLHAAPVLLRDTRVGDVAAVLGSVDVVMGEIDR